MTRSVLIIGGGVIGATSAYALAKQGAAVTLLEARENGGLETSLANGGLQSPSACQPWNGPGVWGHLLASLFKPSPAMQLRWSAIPGLALWGAEFLSNARASQFQAATLANYTLCAFSVKRTHAWAQEGGFEYDRSDLPTLTLFANEKAMASSLAIARLLEPRGLRFDVLNAAQALKIEPALAASAERIGTVIAYQGDSVGDAFKFTQAVLAKAEVFGANLRFGWRCTRLLCEGGRVVGVEANGQTLKADMVVMAAANASRRLLLPLGLHLPVRPAKGYSLTFDLKGAQQRPHHVVADDANHIIATPLGDRLRVAGTAEFAGENLALNARRTANLAAMVGRVYPQFLDRLDLASGSPWTGLRPMSADGRPFVGETRWPGLWLNTGHGHLGWTQAVGSAELLAAQLLGSILPVDPHPFAAARA